jgi:hypothetical protein
VLVYEPVAGEEGAEEEAAETEAAETTDENEESAK